MFKKWNENKWRCDVKHLLHVSSSPAHRIPIAIRNIKRGLFSLLFFYSIHRFSSVGLRWEKVTMVQHSKVHIILSSIFFFRAVCFVDLLIVTFTMAFAWRQFNSATATSWLPWALYSRVYLISLYFVLIFFFLDEIMHLSSWFHPVKWETYCNVLFSTVAWTNESCVSNRMIEGNINIRNSINSICGRNHNEIVYFCKALNLWEAVYIFSTSF